MPVFWGQIDYFATGEGRTLWYYIDYAKDEDEFRQKMIDEFKIEPYYQVGIEISDKIDEKTPVTIFEHWRTLTFEFEDKRQCYGKFAYYCHYNFS